MKRILSLFLSALLLVTLCLPAAAADSETDKRLARVAAKVKQALHIGDEYTSFSGELWENELAPTWSLNWSREEDSLSVTATEDGKVLSYSFQEENLAPSLSEEFPPAFPAVSQEEAQSLAERFLDQVLEAPLESAEFTGDGLARVRRGVYRFSGSVLLNGVASPLSFSLSLRSSDGKVTRFHRDNLEESVIGGVPSAEAGCSRKDAGALLKNTLALRLEYVLDGEDGRAVLRYLPEPGDTYFVDAQSGALVNLTDLYEEASKADGGIASNGAAAMGAMDAAAPEAAPAAGESGLSQAELEGIAKLEGVQSKEALDQILRQTPELGLDRYTLASAGYSLDQETGDVTARLSYTRREDDSFWRRSVTCDARTGALLGVYSSAPYDRERRASVSESEAREKAEAFLGKLWEKEYAASALRESQAWSEGGWGASHTFLYSQQENGYFLPANTLSVAVDVTDGSISDLSRQWTQDVSFDSPEGIISPDAALDAWFSHYETPLVYQNVPVKLDPSREETPLAAALLEMGYTYFYELKLAYVLKGDELARGVDAKTGEVVRLEREDPLALTAYGDVDGHWAAPYLEKLLEYGAGWPGGSCQPDRELTQLDFLALLLSTNGFLWDLEDPDGVDSLYRMAYELGVLTPGERGEEKLLSRGETVRLLLDAAGYGAAAKLQGIFTCSYPDRSDIPEELLGYAALAQGLHLVNGSFAAGRTATRAEAAMLLYNYMNR